MSFESLFLKILRLKLKTFSLELSALSFDMRNELRVLSVYLKKSHSS